MSECGLSIRDQLKNIINNSNLEKLKGDASIIAGAISSCFDQNDSCIDDELKEILLLELTKLEQAPSVLDKLFGSEFQNEIKQLIANKSNDVEVESLTSRVSNTEKKRLTVIRDVELSPGLVEATQKFLQVLRALNATDNLQEFYRLLEDFNKNLKQTDADTVLDTCCILLRKLEVNSQDAKLFTYLYNNLIEIKYHYIESNIKYGAFSFAAACRSIFQNCDQEEQNTENNASQLVNLINTTQEFKLKLSSSQSVNSEYFEAIKFVLSIFNTNVVQKINDGGSISKLLEEREKILGAGFASVRDHKIYIYSRYIDLVLDDLSANTNEIQQTFSAMQLKVKSDEDLKLRLTILQKNIVVLATEYKKTDVKNYTESVLSELVNKKINQKNIKEILPKLEGIIHDVFALKPSLDEILEVAKKESLEDTKLILKLTQFGEMLERNFSDIKPETIEKELRDFAPYFKGLLQNQQSIALVAALEEIISSLQKEQRQESQCFVPNSLAVGLFAFKNLLDIDTASAQIENERKERMKQFIQEDLLPNTAKRKEIEKELRDFKAHCKKINDEKDRKEMLEGIAEVRKLTDNYFSKVEKTGDAKNTYKEKVGKVFKDKEKHISHHRRPEWLRVAGRVLRVIAVLPLIYRAVSSLIKGKKVNSSSLFGDGPTRSKMQAKKIEDSISSVVAAPAA